MYHSKASEPEDVASCSTRRRILSSLSVVWEQKDHPQEPVVCTGLMGSLAWGMFWGWSRLNGGLLPEVHGPPRHSSQNLELP